MLRGNFNALASQIGAVFKGRHLGRSEVLGFLEAGGQNRTEEPAVAAKRSYSERAVKRTSFLKRY